MAIGEENASHLPFPLVHRRPISTQSLTHLSRMANWAPVYSPQQWNSEGKEGWRGPTTSGNYQAKRALDPEIPVSDPSPLLTPLMPLLIPSTTTFPFHLSPSSSLLPHLFLSSYRPGCPSFPCLFGSGPNPNRLSNCFKNILPFSAPSLPPLCPVFILGNRHSLS